MAFAIPQATHGNEQSCQHGRRHDLRHDVQVYRRLGQGHAEAENGCMGQCLTRAINSFGTCTLPERHAPTTITSNAMF